MERWRAPRSTSLTAAVNRRESPIESHHQRAAVRERQLDVQQLVPGQRERLLHEHPLACPEGGARQRRVAVVSGRDHDRIDPIVRDDLLGRQRPLESEPGGGIGRAQSAFAGDGGERCAGLGKVRV